ncbi:NAC domain-containing protein 55-like [Papaver somniferum]|uniref:NAC domain-containing protein 55-like n=1 Tax=Papaver somniferum TaxID=3469 RepID=UPI000E6FA519|nr:NAC domain-containing protein 55-like [Papaver somniferum]
MSKFQAPTGYRFKPTDEVLIRYYLVPKVEGKPLPSEHIFETGELYGKESPDIEVTFGQGKEWYKQFASYDENFDDTLYFFTKLTKKWENGSRISRSAGRGTWTGDKGEQIYKDQSYKVRKRYFSYTDNAAKSKGRKRKMTTLTSDGNSVTWNMYEYSILRGEQMLDHAIVKIRRIRSTNGGSTSSPSSTSSKQYYANTDYHTGAGGAGLQHFQGSSISSGNVVPASEDNYLQHKPFTSSTKLLDAAGFPDFSFSWFLQDAVPQPQQKIYSYGDSLYNKHLWLPSAYRHKTVVPPYGDYFYNKPLSPSVYQDKTVVPPLFTDDQKEENNLDLSADLLQAAVAADDSRAIGGDNAASDGNQECTNDTLMINSEVEAVQPEKESGMISYEELDDDLEYILETGLF